MIFLEFSVDLFVVVKSPSKNPITSLLFGEKVENHVDRSFAIPEKPLTVDIFEKLNSIESLCGKLSVKELLDVQDQITKVLLTCNKVLKNKM